MDIKMKNIGITTSVISTVAILGLASLALSAEFSADSKRVMPSFYGGTTTITGKVAVKGEMERQETVSPTKQIMIIRPDKGVKWIVNPTKRTYTEMPVQPVESRKSLPDKMKHIPNFKKAGTAKVAGYVCDKYTFNDTKNQLSGAVYFSNRLQHELKADTKMFGINISSGLSNIKEGKQSASLFNIPKGYKKVQVSPMGLPGLFGKGMPGPPPR
jgi:hypothetical protein